MSPDVLVTKHCSENVLNFIRQGSIRIGTLSDYRKSEGLNALLSDRSEGQGSKAVKGDLPNFTGFIDNDFFSGNVFVDVKRPIVTSVTMDCNVFCCSVGPYDSNRHKRIMIGNSEYGSNPAQTHFLEFDKERLNDAIAKTLMEHYHKNIQTFRGKVTYDRRDRVIDSAYVQEEMSSDSMNRFGMELVHKKPALYSLEEEYRFAFMPEGGGPDIVMTRDLSVDTRRRVMDAIVNFG
jgi:hypothetical protein